jgi:RNA ligase
MIHVSNIMDEKNLAKMVNEKMIDRKESGDGRVLYNYTAKAQYSRTWNDETRQCRGLVTDSKGFILARPFPKFWNLGEVEVPNLPNEPFQVFDKLDGSLIIAYLYDGELAVNTRGSFTSRQALDAYEWLAQPTDPCWFRGIDETYLFEWIAPDNRIVVDYGDRRECVLLDVIDTRTGRSVGRPQPFTRAESISVDRLDDLPDRENAEGYVVRFQRGLRVKIKHPRYVEIHRALNGLNEHRVWEMLKQGEKFDEMLAIVPDESYRWIDTTKSDLETRFGDLLAKSESEFADILDSVGEDGDRKEFAALALKSDLRAVLFALLDDKPEDRIHELIWKMIEPRGMQDEVNRD